MAVKNLYELFEGEKEKYLSSETGIDSIYYNKNYNSIQYKAEIDALTMKFDKVSDDAEAYHRIETKKKSGIGNLVVEIDCGDVNSNLSAIAKAEETAEWQRVPDTLKDVVKSYAFESDKKKGLTFENNKKKSSRVQEGYER